jgi:hypothetical protein
MSAMGRSHNTGERINPLLAGRCMRGLDRFAATDEVVGEPLHQTMTTFGSDRTDGPEKAAGREDHQKTEPDERSSLESAGGEIGIARLDNSSKPRTSC